MSTNATNTPNLSQSMEQPTAQRRQTGLAECPAPADISRRGQSVQQTNILFAGDTFTLTAENKWRDILDEFGAAFAADIPESISLLKSREFGCVVVSLRDAAEEGAVLIEQIAALNRHIPIIVLSSFISTTTASRMMRFGAHNCLDASSSADDLWQAVDGALEEKRMHDKCNAARVASPAEPWRSILVGDSPALQAVADTIRLAGPRKCTILIQGETGTGKEVAARAIHMASPRAAQSMVAVNCSALPENLLEAELFGHTRGAFTGAHNHRIGRFEQANKGTLFLDEIGDMPLDMQAKLLRVLQDREFQRLGSSETIKVDVRIIAATNVDLLERVRQGRFREDLYYRLNVVALKMPPLRSPPRTSRPWPSTLRRRFVWLRAFRYGSSHRRLFGTFAHVRGQATFVSSRTRSKWLSR